MHVAMGVVPEYSAQLSGDAFSPHSSLLCRPEEIAAGTRAAVSCLVNDCRCVALGAPSTFAGFGFSPGGITVSALRPLRVRNFSSVVAQMIRLSPNRRAGNVPRGWLVLSGRLTRGTVLRVWPQQEIAFKRSRPCRHVCDRRGRSIRLIPRRWYERAHLLAPHGASDTSPQGAITSWCVVRGRC
jgi:hypothetical protein